MARARDPNRDKAFEIYKQHKGEITNRKIAEILSVPEKTISAWKSRDKWNAVLQNGKCSTTNKNRSTTKAEKVTNPKTKERKRSGNPNPTPRFTKHNKASEKHGLFSKYLPQEMQDIIEKLEMKSPADMLWDQIVIQYANILRSQEIMFVKNKEELVKELKREKHQSGEKGNMWEEEYELQFAWDRQAQLLQAQARAITELRTSINQFIKLADEEDERKLKLEQMQLNIDKTKVEIEKLGSDEQNGPIEIKIVSKKQE